MLYAEWIDYMGAYRLFFKTNPEQTIAYEDELSYAETWAELRGLQLCVIKYAEEDIQQ